MADRSVPPNKGYVAFITDPEKEKKKKKSDVAEERNGTGREKKERRNPSYPGRGGEKGEGKGLSLELSKKRTMISLLPAKEKKEEENLSFWSKQRRVHLTKKNTTPRHAL